MLRRARSGKPWQPLHVVHRAVTPRSIRGSAAKKFLSRPRAPAQIIKLMLDPRPRTLPSHNRSSGGSGVDWPRHEGLNHARTDVGRPLCQIAVIGRAVVVPASSSGTFTSGVLGKPPRRPSNRTADDESHIVLSNTDETVPIRRAAPRRRPDRAWNSWASSGQWNVFADNMISGRPSSEHGQKRCFYKVRHCAYRPSSEICIPPALVQSASLTCLFKDSPRRSSRYTGLAGTPGTDLASITGH